MPPAKILKREMRNETWLRGEDGDNDISASARLLRGFAIDFLTCHDLTVVNRIMDRTTASPSAAIF